MNKWLPAVAVGAFAMTAGLLYLAGGGGETTDAPIAAPPGESLRLRPASAPPVAADPKQVKEKLSGQPLAPGDAALLQTLEAELEAGVDPSYRAMFDVPFAENAGPELRDEVKGWIDRKMASFGFTGAEKRPSLLWRVALDPGEQGVWRLKYTLRRGGETSLEREVEVPAEFSEGRLDEVMGQDFAAPPK